MTATSSPQPTIQPQVHPSITPAVIDKIRGIAIVSTLNMELLEFGPGTCKVRVPKDAAYDNVWQTYHGGMLTTVADTIAYFAIITLTGPDALITTTDLHVRFLNTCTTDVTAVARVIKLGKSLCPVQVDLYDANETLVAVSQVTYMRLNP
jgi:acyl-coenzyme A thioesterase 13